MRAGDHTKVCEQARIPQATKQFARYDTPPFFSLMDSFTGVFTALLMTGSMPCFTPEETHDIFYSQHHATQ